MTATSSSPDPIPTRLLLLLDGRSPAGAQGHSGGMEAAVMAGLVRDLSDVRDFCARAAPYRRRGDCRLRGCRRPSVEHGLVTLRVAFTRRRTVRSPGIRSATPGVAELGQRPTPTPTGDRA